MYMRSVYMLAKFWLPVGLCAGIIFYLSAIPSLESGFEGSADWVLRKGAHIFVYAVLTWLVFRALHHGHNTQKKTTILLAAILALFYAFSDEFHQHFVPGRHGRLRDVAVDAVGILAVLVILSFDKLKVKPRTQQPSQILSDSSRQVR